MDYFQELSTNEDFLKRVVEDEHKLVSTSDNRYLEEIFEKCKIDGYFTKFNDFIDFKDYFKDEGTYKKLWEFLISKGYKIVGFDQFLNKIAGTEVSSTKESGLFANIPSPAFGDITIPKEENRRFPDILRLGTICHGSCEVPLMIPLYEEKGLSFIVENDDQKAKASKAIEIMAFRILCCLPDGKCKFYIIDPEKNGQSFSHLYGLDSRILESEVWDDVAEISNGLHEIKNDIPRIQSELLTSKYKDLIEYNEQVKHSRKPFQFILITNFPNSFTSTSIEHLQGIIKNGSKSGIYVMMSMDIKQKYPELEKFNTDEFRKLTIEYDFNSNKINNVHGKDLINEKFYITSICDKFPPGLVEIKEKLNQALDKVHQLKIDAINESDIWQKSAAKGLTIPIGVSIDNKLFNLQFGDGKDVHHALIGGATGKGKTVLIHDIIINASKLYSPDELQFILMDYKEGTEFKVYERLPHIKVLAISGEVEFGLSVFEFLTEEISRRGLLFKESGYSDFSSFKASINVNLPRWLVIMDEFQVLLDPKKRVSSKISAMLEDVTRRGRSFGINIILCTQSLGEVDISSSTLGQLGVRIAFSMPEYDCMKILHVDNVIPSEFTKAGQAVYNTSQGKKEGNTIFQSAFIDKKTIETELNILASKQSPITDISKKAKQFIFDGTQDVIMQDNVILYQKISENGFVQNDLFADSFIGEPFFLSDEHIALRFRKQQESNLLIIGDDAGGAISCAFQCIEQTINQSHPESKVFLFDIFPIDSGLRGRFNSLKVPDGVELKIISNNRLFEETLIQISAEIENRFADDNHKGRILLCIMNANSIREMRKVGYELTHVAMKLFSILKDGPELGIHTILHFLNRKSFEDSFERNAYDEFENKILLKGQTPADYGKTNEEVVTNDFSGFVIHPRSKYEADKFKIYKI
jgi:hypothetical protein